MGLTLDRKLSFYEHINEEIRQANKCVDLLQKLQGILPRTGLLTIYKLFIRHLLDYADIIYHQTFNTLLSIKGSSCEKFVQELELE